MTTLRIRNYDAHLYFPAPSIDALLSVVTWITLSFGAGLCVTVNVFPFDVERVICGILLCLGYVFLPFMAALFATRSMCPQSDSSSTQGLGILCHFLTRLVHLGSPGLIASVENNTSTFVYPPNDADADGSSVAAARVNECAVCLDCVVSGDTARKLPCNHVFHKACADSWLLTSRKNCCPLCMRKICPERDDDMHVLRDMSSEK